MRKLTLVLDSLAVQSFHTSGPEGAATGTVHGRAAVPEPTYGCSNTPDCIFTQQLSCKGSCEADTCYESCYGSCHSCITSCRHTECYTCHASCGTTCPYCAEPTLPTET